MWNRKEMPVWRFGVLIVFLLIGSLGLYWGIGKWLTEPILSWTLPLKGQVIVIDAGHGGVDPGAVSDTGVLEKDVNLKVALKLRDLLQQAGAQVVLVREEDRDLARTETKGYTRRKVEDLKERVELLNELRPTVFLSLHCNAVESERQSGAQTFYNGTLPESKLLASSIQEGLRETLEMGRVVKERGDIFILKRAEVPGALVEMGFLSNPEEAKKLTDERHQSALALAIYKGVLSYFAQLHKSKP
jgi:N-acetylmuramoyl-L-alanine amidase